MTNEEANRIVWEAVEEAVENRKPILYRLPDANEYERIELSGTIHMCKQEKFHILNYVGILQLITVGFGKVFGREAVTIALNAYDMIIERYGENAVIIAGHTPTIVKGEFTYNEGNVFRYYDKEKDCIFYDIDCGCVFRGLKSGAKLACLRLEDEAVFYV